MGDEVAGYGNEGMPTLVAIAPLTELISATSIIHSGLPKPRVLSWFRPRRAHLTLRHHRPDQPLEKTVDGIVVDRPKSA